MEGIPGVYLELKTMALRCLQDLKIDQQARTIFSTAFARGAMDDLLLAVIEALELISACYSKSPLGSCLIH